MGVSVLDCLVATFSTHLHFFTLKEKEDEEASPSLQGDTWPPDLFLPESTLGGVADDMGLDGVEARVEAEGNIWLRMQAASTLEVHLKPGGGVVGLLSVHRGPKGREEPQIDVPKFGIYQVLSLSYLCACRGTTPCSMTILPAYRPPKIVVA